MGPEDRSVEREVKSEDPSLSTEANRVLSEEAREAVGSDRARVPAGTSRAHEETGGASSTLGATLASNRPLLIISFFTLLTVGVIVSLATDSWWALAAALVVHFVGTVIVVGATAQMSTETEHVSPAAAARLEEEGVPDPDQRLSELVAEFDPDQRESQQRDVTPSDSSRPV
jgi:energy-converting hydrogenase Eha subunit C